METMNLKEVQNILEEIGLECSYSEANDEHPLDTLWVSLNDDYLGRGGVLKISLHEMLMGAPSKDSALSDNLSSHYKIEFHVEFPIKVNSFAFIEVARLICFINTNVAMPQFELYEFDNKVGFRHVLLTTPEGLNPPLLMGIVGAINMYSNMYLEMIEKVAEGIVSAGEVYELILGADTANIV